MLLEYVEANYLHRLIATEIQTVLGKKMRRKHFAVIGQLAPNYSRFIILSKTRFKGSICRLLMLRQK